ncbi:hypothetical protein HYT57_02725 [Candidatus Woesearchaeota archaeon]|nr:hypothetical protein [Candidatus Woesearchaeota archaeon]
MSLEKYLASVKWLDEQALRQYTKVAKKWEDKGRNIYVLSSAISFPSIMLLCNIPQFKPTEHYTVLFGSGVFGGLDMGQNIIGLMGLIKDEIVDSDDAQPIGPRLISTQTNPIVRLPMLLTGIILLGRSGYDVYNYFANGEPMPNETPFLVQTGLAHIGIASSMYLKARNPKLLQKETLREKTYKLAKAKIEEFKEKAKDWLPQPQPVPIPIRNYKKLEDCLD